MPSAASCIAPARRSPSFSIKPNERFMKQQNRFDSSEEQQHQSGSQTRGQAAREFATAEELLRYDAAHTPVPAGMAKRLAQSAINMPAPPRSWWRRLFGGG